MENEMSALSVDGTTLFLIAMAAIATYMTRIGGYVLMKSMKRIPPRVESALNAVPAAVLTTLVPRRSSTAAGISRSPWW